LTIDTYIRAQMARFAIEEGGRHGGVNNMLAVAQVLRNRVFAGWGDWLEVVQRAPEKRATIYPPHMSELRSGNVRVLLNKIDDVYTKADAEDLTAGALFYVEPGFPVAEWFKTEVLDRPDEHRRTAHVGPVWFFN
jgi:hypothetical protein